MNIVENSSNKQKSDNEEEDEEIQIIGLDLSHQGIKSITNAVFVQFSLKKLILNNNNISVIPSSLCMLKRLEKLDLSYNKIKSIPQDLGKCISLKELFLNNNMITSVPLELGTLFQISSLNLDGNPLMKPFSTLYADNNLLSFCRDNNGNYNSPRDRTWIHIEDFETTPMINQFSIGTFNILTNFGASKCTYAPSWVISPECRKDTILKTITSYNLDIVCLQEMEEDSYVNIYDEYLETSANYKSIYLKKPGISYTTGDVFAPQGCAIFWKKDKFSLVEEFYIYYGERAQNDNRFTKNIELYKNLCKRNEVALVVILKAPNGENVIIANTHLFFKPGSDEVRLFQIDCLLMHLERVRTKYKGAPVVLAGDLNSTRDSLVYQYILDKKTSVNIFNKSANSSEYANTNKGMSHSLKFSDAYAEEVEGFTFYSPFFKGIIDYIFHSNNLVLNDVISLIEEEYADRTIGFPNIHSASDHILIGCKLSFRPIHKYNYYSRL